MRKFPLYAVYFLTIPANMRPTVMISRQLSKPFEVIVLKALMLTSRWNIGLCLAAFILFLG
jgi:hypothetical protein